MTAKQAPSRNTATTVSCPTCKASVIWDELSIYRPFCSKRCQQIDFGEWASEKFSIPGTAPTEDDLEEIDDTRH